LVALDRIKGPEPRFCVVFQAVVFFATAVLVIINPFIFLGSREFGFCTDFVPISRLRRQQFGFITNHPYARLTGSVTDGDFRCGLFGAIAVAVNWSDESDMWNMTFDGKGPGLRFLRRSLTVNWTAESRARLGQMKEDFAKCNFAELPEPSLCFAYSMEGFSSRIEVVAENEEATRGYGWRSAVAWASLFAGVLPVYKVDSIPMVWWNIRMNDVVVGHIPACAEAVWECN
jgi:hypothetical protein